MKLFQRIAVIALFALAACSKESVEPPVSEDITVQQDEQRPAPPSHIVSGFYSECRYGGLSCEGDFVYEVTKLGRYYIRFKAQLKSFTASNATFDPIYYPTPRSFTVTGSIDTIVFAPVHERTFGCLLNLKLTNTDATYAPYYGTVNLVVNTAKQSVTSTTLEHFFYNCYQE